ncbi:MAG: hypothetical protein HN509_13185, partial [Halobacteriovoraceae bacterium]|nr:hypothetical protein [Halobacteriovoraceae bacterium]
MKKSLLTGLSVLSLLISSTLFSPAISSESSLETFLNQKLEQIQEDAEKAKEIRLETAKLAREVNSKKESLTGKSIKQSLAGAASIITAISARKIYKSGGSKAKVIVYSTLAVALASYIGGKEYFSILTEEEILELEAKMTDLYVTLEKLELSLYEKSHTIIMLGSKNNIASFVSKEVDLISDTMKVLEEHEIVLSDLQELLADREAGVTRANYGATVASIGFGAMAFRTVMLLVKSGNSKAKIIRNLIGATVLSGSAAGILYLKGLNKT